MRNLRGKEWFPTQPEAKWNNIDPVSKSFITDWFADREVFSNTKMDRVFWMTYNINLQTYLNMLRIQASNETFDPAVNRYLESLRNYLSMFTGGAMSSKVNEHRSMNQRQVVHSAPDEIVTDRSEDYGARHEVETDTWDNKEKEITRDGVRQLHRQGDGSRNYTMDAPGSHEVTATSENRSLTVSRGGKEIIKDETMNAGMVTEAVKAAPMTAVNLATVATAAGPGGDANDSFAAVAKGSLWHQNWESASQYSENGSQSGTSAQREVSYDNDKRVETSVSDPESNKQIHEFGRHQQTGTDILETESFSGYGEREIENGSESKDIRDDGHQDNVRERATHSYGPVTDSGTGSDSMSSNGEESKHENKSDEDWLRFTGREGLTPQEAFATGLKYLTDYPNAIYWFIGQLESCFIGILDDEEE